MKDWLGGVMAMDQHYADELRRAYMQAVELAMTLKGHLVQVT